MRLSFTAILLCTALSLGLASEGSAQTVSINRVNAPLKKVLADLRGQTDYGIIVKPEVNTSRIISIQRTGVDVRQLLSELERLTGFTYSLNDKDRFIVIDRQNIKKDAPENKEFNAGALDAIEVTGRIVNPKAEPLSGAAIRVTTATGKHTQLHTISDQNGYFTLKNVSMGYKLEVSYVGYVTRQIDARADLGNIMLQVASSEVEEVLVNTGYYAVRDRERTGSIARVTAKDIEGQPINNVFSAVQGRVAGVNIAQNNGVPGSGYRIEIRGRNSLRTIGNSGVDGNQPLYVVDGVPIGNQVGTNNIGVILNGGINPLNAFNPGDIESVEILKDADATSIYGSRGANGVVLITTKKGRSGHLGLTFRSSYGMSRVKSNLKLLNTDQYLDMRRQAYANSGITTYPAAAYDINGTWDQNRSTDWVDKLIGNTAGFFQNQLSLQGGSELTTFLLSASHDQQTTVYGHGYKYKTTNVSNAINHRSKDGRLLVSASNRFSMQSNNMMRSDVTRQAHLLAPNSPELYKEDGSLNWENNTFSNPLGPYQSTYNNDNKQTLNSLNAQYELLPGLQLKLNTGLNYFAFEDWALEPNTMYNPAFVTGQSSAYSRASRYTESRFSVIAEPQIDYVLKKGPHELTVLVGGTYQQETNKTASTTGTGFESNAFIRNLAAAKTKTIGDQITTDYRYVAAFGRVNYQLSDRYILNITGRRDGSSRFGPNNKFANFAAVGGAWLFSEEKMLAGLSWLNLGKLRASFGTTGSDALGDYQYLDTYNISSDLVYDGVTGIKPVRLYNPDFSWEKTVKLETALELTMFENRLNLTAAWYRNRSSCQLVGYQLPAITGFGSVQANLDATVQNKGIELEASFKILDSKDFQWQSGINVSAPRNKLVSFPGLAGSTYGNSYIIGYPTSISKLYKLEGVDPATRAYKFNDYNGDGLISSPHDNQVIADLTTQYHGGWHNSLTYGNWDLSFLLQFVKQDSRNYNYILPNPGNAIVNVPVEVLDVWSESNPNGLYMPYRVGANAAFQLFQYSDITVSDGSYIRLRNVALNYKVPLKKTAIKHLNVFFQGQNLWAWTNFFGMDPETTLSWMPPLRTLSFGTQINF
ncbi:SusC/RagA family TonB-linked outer membrane protein [Sphingobacterium tabacisoli]|uniref:SusC/RagA family TonB-linked outer membrane protein n=1 Tax=Sphingobacterium tabacisoli TaxID=2044855 RepID=A0ABW5L0Q8_9SPHI|nr:SusC/RagA family TonB-linked outer membrane protein [Sphingobacterium tabacisoli]